MVIGADIGAGGDRSQDKVDLSDLTKEIHFVRRLPRNAQAGDYILFSGSVEDRDSDDRSALHRIDINTIYRRGEAEWKRSFINALGSLNGRNAAVEWWAFTATAKNLLSSALGNRIFETLALCKIVEEGQFQRLFVVGADNAQIETFKQWCDKRSRPYSIMGVRRPSLAWLFPIESVLRNIYHVLRVFRFFYFGRKSIVRPASSIDVCLFTYMDENLSQGEDAFFGKLASLIHAKNPNLTVQVTGFVHSRYRRVLPKLKEVMGDQYYPIYYELRLSDFLWALWKTISVRISNFTTSPCMAIADLDLSSLLKQALRDDVTQGRYLHNLLVYRAAFRFAARHKPAILIYPYENKSLEKLLLLGMRMANAVCRFVGYQHTSITPRHTTLLFAEGEASKTPLADKILTVGDITRDYLEKYGNYPRGIFETACALRQASRNRADYNPVHNRPMRILLALSSSKMELLEAVTFVKRVKENTASYEIGIRPHPEFPLTALPDDARNWIRVNAQDYSGTTLASNIDWCDVVAYVSSTVALEALMAGKPVINFRIGDPINPDPILGDAPLCWRVNTPDQFLSALREIRAMSEEDYEQGSARAHEYAVTYLRPLSSKIIERFYAFC